MDSEVSHKRHLTSSVNFVGISAKQVNLSLQKMVRLSLSLLVLTKFIISVIRRRTVSIVSIVVVQSTRRVHVAYIVSVSRVRSTQPLAVFQRLTYIKRVQILNSSEKRFVSYLRQALTLSSAS